MSGNGRIANSLFLIVIVCSVVVFLTVKPGVTPAVEAQELDKGAKAEAEVPTFANLALVRAGVYDSGTGVAIITTGEKHDATVALTQLVGRRQCWRDKFPERFKRMRTESLAHRTIAQNDGCTNAWGNTLPWAFVITYDVE